MKTGSAARFLDLLYPPKCVFCRRLLARGEWDICNDCRLKLPVCGGTPKKGRFLSGACAPFYYEGAVCDSLLRYKFHGMSQYAGCYGPLLAACISSHLAGRYDLMTWVPVSRKRLRQRGYDQALLLAQETGACLGLKPQRMLQKRRDNPAQSSLTGVESRRANVAGVYEAVHPERFAGRKILLIDDIMTTGATLSEAARTLLTAGAAEVVCAAFAATRKSDNNSR